MLFSDLRMYVATRKPKTIPGMGSHSSFFHTTRFYDTPTSISLVLVGIDLPFILPGDRIGGLGDHHSRLCSARTWAVRIKPGKQTRRSPLHRPGSFDSALQLPFGYNIGFRSLGVATGEPKTTPSSHRQPFTMNYSHDTRVSGYQAPA